MGRYQTLLRSQPAVPQNLLKRLFHFSLAEEPAVIRTTMLSITPPLFDYPSLLLALDASGISLDETDLIILQHFIVFRHYLQKALK